MIDWLLGFNTQQQYFSYIQVMNMTWMIKWTWNDDEMKNGMGYKDNGVDKFRLPLETGRGGKGQAILPPVADPYGSYSGRIPQ